MGVDFYEWLNGTGWVFSIGWCRYAQFGEWEYLACASIMDDKVVEYVNDLDGSDCEAIDAADELKRLAEKEEIYIATDKDPAEAMKKVIEQLKEVHKKQC